MALVTRDDYNKPQHGNPLSVYFRILAPMSKARFKKPEYKMANIIVNKLNSMCTYNAAISGL